MKKGFTKQQVEFRQAVKTIQSSGLYQHPLETHLLEIIFAFTSVFVRGKLSATDLPAIEFPTEEFWDFNGVNCDTGAQSIIMDLTADGIIASAEFFLKACSPVTSTQPPSCVRVKQWHPSSLRYRRCRIHKNTSAHGFLPVRASFWHLG